MKRNASSWTRAGARRLHMPFGPKLRTASKSSDERYVVQLSCRRYTSTCRPCKPDLPPYSPLMNKSVESGNFPRGGALN